MYSQDNNNMIIKNNLWYIQTMEYYMAPKMSWKNIEEPGIQITN
jgi:hypothetical protein